MTGRSSLSRPLPVLALVACLLLAGCTGDGQPGQRRTEGSVRVDTPALRALKAATGVQPCRPGAGRRTVKDGLPDLTLPCLGGGRSVTLSGLRGPMVINLFAQWCGPCRKELPFYQRLHQRARGKVRVLGVDSLDTQPDNALRLARDSGVTFPLLADPTWELRTDLLVHFLPTVVFLAADGTVTKVQSRAFSSYAELRAAVREELGVTVPA